MILDLATDMLVAGDVRIRLQNQQALVLRELALAYRPLTAPVLAARAGFGNTANPARQCAVIVSSIRAKVKLAGLQPLIKSGYGTGYQLIVPVEIAGRDDFIAIPPLLTRDIKQVARAAALSGATRPAAERILRALA